MMKTEKERRLDLEFIITEAQNWHSEAEKVRMTPQMLGMLRTILNGKIKRPDTPGNHELLT